MPNEPNMPDLDLIQMVQRARMQHDADAQPSQVAAVYWIESKPATPTQAPTPRAGCWEIHTTTATVDAIWQRVKTATEAGELGYKSRVSTASHGKSKNADDRLIRVMTYDADDQADVARVGEKLRALDLGTISYQRP